MTSWIYRNSIVVDQWMEKKVIFLIKRLNLDGPDLLLLFLVWLELSLCFTTQKKFWWRKLSVRLIRDKFSNVAIFPFQYRKLWTALVVDMQFRFYPIENLKLKFMKRESCAINYSPRFLRRIFLLNIRRKVYGI